MRKLEHGEIDCFYQSYSPYRRQLCVDEKLVFLLKHSNRQYWTQIMDTLSNMLEHKESYRRSAADVAGMLFDVVKILLDVARENSCRELPLQRAGEAPDGVGS